MINWNGPAKYWTKTLNPCFGCRPESEGCANCYAKGVVERFGINNGDFTPKLRDYKPCKSGIVFVGNMTDLFGEWMSDEQIQTVINGLSRDFAVNLILTKRAYRLNEWSYWRILSDKSACDDMLPHCWFGATCENQERLNERIHSLCSTAYIDHRWVSFEPLLSEIIVPPLYFYKNNEYYCSNRDLPEHKKSHICPKCSDGPVGYGGINWAVIGAESGPNRRRCDLAWVRSLVHQMQDNGVPVFVKQLDIDGKLEKDMDKFPEDLRIRQMPDEFNIGE